MEPVSVIDAKAFSREEFERRIRGSKPILIRGGAAHWPAVSKWSVRKSNISPSEGQFLPLTLVTLSKRKVINFSEFLENLGREKGVGGYYADGGRNLGESDRTGAATRVRLRYLENDIGHPDVPKSFLVQSHQSLWIGGKATTAPHFDSFENLYATINGTKKITLINPKYSRKMCPVALRKGVVDCDITSGQVKRLTLLSKPIFNYSAYNWSPKTIQRLQNSGVTVFNCSVKPGDVLYIPCNWWHHVESIPDIDGLCSAVSTFYKPFWGYIRLKNLGDPGKINDKSVESLITTPSEDERKQKIARARAIFKLIIPKSASAARIINPEYAKLLDTYFSNPNLNNRNLYP
ncbi:hypothetical protein AAMO2058_000927400 [Amorphochlora amoebiformis]